MSRARCSLLGGLFLIGCTSSGRAVDADPQLASADTPAPSAVAPAHPSKRTIAPIDDRQWTMHSINMTLVVGDPSRAMSSARRIVRELGGEITNVNSAVDSANLNATVPARRHEAARVALSRIDGTVQSESASAADQRQYVEQLHDRARLLTRGQSQLDAMMRSATEPRTVDALALLHQLAKQDLDNVTNQIANYERQTETSQIYVSFVKNAAAPASPARPQ